ncbi:MAG: AI-2E family transporter [Lachnospiraceae bacterium]|jgi:predicted PurR-regulated permease PerM|nr:AI-2E family transporter [Lachnospiraceae bacterium]
MKWKDKVNKRYIRMAVFFAVLILIYKVIDQLADHAPEIFASIMAGLNWLLKVAKPIIFGFVMAYILKPLNDFFTDRYARVKFLRKRSRLLGVFTVLLLIILVITAIASAIVYSVTHQLQFANLDETFKALTALTNSLTNFYESLLAKLNSLDIGSEQLTNSVGKISGAVIGFVQNLANGVLGSFSDIAGYVTTVMFGLIIGIYFMVDGQHMTGYFSEVADAVFTERANARIRHFLNDVDEVFSGYIRGQLMDVAFMILATSTAMMLTGISLAPIIGLLTGLANLVPYLGPFVGYASIILISIVEGKYQVMIASIIALLIIQTLDGNVIEAKFIGKSIKVHPLLVVIFLIFGNAIGGLWGMLLAVPVGAYFQKVFTNYVEKRKNAKKLARAKRNSVVDETDDEAEYVDGSQA